METEDSNTGTTSAQSESGAIDSADILGLSIRTKVTCIVVALALVSLITVGFIVGIQSRAALTEQARNHLLMISSQKAAEYGLVFQRLQDEGGSDFSIYERSLVT